MGFFSNIFKSNNEIEKTLSELYIPIFQSMMSLSLSEATTQFNSIFDQVKQESQEEGTINLPKNFGDVLIENENKEEKYKNMLLKRRNEGVTDDDIRWWWNIHDYDRRLMIKIDEINRLTLFINRKEEGLDSKASAEIVRKVHPMYGDTEDTSVTKGNDRPLPYELKDRINIYIEKRNIDNPDKFKEEIKEFSSFNALIRNEIRNGNL